jgi:CubicO group peptidase (beta-lactamase class C family)
MRSLALLSLAAACGQAPTKTGADQVHDPNIELTALKDNKFTAMSWNTVDTYMDGVIGAANNPGCAVGIARGGQLTYLHGYGKAQLGGENWGVATVGAVGSVSKTFTAAGMLLMDQLNMLDVDDDVDEHIAGGAAAVGNVSIAQLLNHTSGVGGASQAAAFAPNWEAGSDAETCIDTGVGCTATAHDLAEPRLAYAQYGGNESVAALGGLANYSNVGYSVVGAVIDELTEATADDGYEGWIWNRVGGWPASDLDAQNLLSLALTHSWRATDIPHRAVGYNGAFAVYEAFDPDGLADVEGWEGPAGGWVMTIGDLTRFTVALNTTKIVNGAFLAAMRNPWAQFNSLPDDAGMGVLIPVENGTDLEDTPDYWHGGLIGGHSAAWTWWNNSNGQSLAIALMCNRNDISPYTLLDHAEKLAKRIQGSSPTLPIATSVAVPISTVHGRAFHLDRSGAHQALPTGATLPITELLHQLVLRTQVSGGQLSLSLVEAAVSQGHYTPASNRTPTALGVASLTNPRFTSRPATVRLASPLGDVVLRDTVIAGTIESGPKLSNVSVRGTLDARELGALIGRTGSQLCGELQTTGTTCTPCADGAPMCVAFDYQRYAGALVTP